MKLRKISGIVIAAFASLFLFSVQASAQDAPDGPQTQGDDAVYISVTHVNFKPGKRTDAMTIIAENFVPASEAAGQPGPLLAIHYQTGKWDATFVWVMKGGMSDLEWFVSEDDIAWRNALNEQAGGEEEAQAILDSFMKMIAHAETDVGHYHTGEEAED